MTRQRSLTDQPWHERLRLVLAERRGARLGETTVVSRQVHMTEAGTPQEVIILPSVDAGQQFYGRAAVGEIVHLDIFHAIADVDHRRVAATLLQALGDVPLAAPEGGRLLDYFDLMTGTGGGRVTGCLGFGQKLSLRAAHKNHVHLAGRIPDEQLHLLVRMVSLVEAELGAQGVELRRVERIRHGQAGRGTQQLDLSHYTDESDSWLRGSGPPGGSTGSGSGSAGGNGSGAGTGGGAGTGTAGSGQGAGAGGERGEGSGSGPWQGLNEEERLQQALELSRKLGSPDEVKRVLDQFSREHGWAAAYASGNSQAPFLIRQLEQEGLLRRELRGIHLTEAGRELVKYLEYHLRDVKLRFRKLIRRLPAAAVRQGARTGPSVSPPSPDVRYGPVRGTAPAQDGSWISDLAVPETVRAALTRTHLERLTTGGPKPRGFRLEHRDVHVHLRSADQPLQICLLIDASASMAGRRILAAKHLARHLLVSTRDRIAVIAFQEREVKIYVPFTRDWSQVEEGLSRIQPLGLTPLAHGLTQSLDLIRQSRVRRPLLLLITDGIPTVPKWTIDPLADALEAARHVGRQRIPFGCIGLQPSRRYLEELTREAGGTLHVVEELAEDSLVAIAHRERLKVSGGGKVHRP